MLEDAFHNLWININKNLTATKIQQTHLKPYEPH